MEPQLLIASLHEHVPSRISGQHDILPERGEGAKFDTVGVIIALLAMVGIMVAMSMKVLAARKLQRPLTDHLCRAAVYPTTDKAWQVSRVATLSGRGPTFLEAPEALCREADGLRLPAVVDIYYFRAPDGWSETHE